MCCSNTLGLGTLLHAGYGRPVVESRIVSVRTDRLLNKHHASSINALIKTEVGSCFVLVVHSVCDEPALLA